MHEDISIDASGWQYALSLLHHWSGSFASGRSAWSAVDSFCDSSQIPAGSPKNHAQTRRTMAVTSRRLDSERLRTYRQKQTRLAGHSLVKSAVNWAELTLVKICACHWLMALVSAKAHESSTGNGTCDPSQKYQLSKVLPGLLGLLDHAPSQVASKFMICPSASTSAAACSSAAESQHRKCPQQAAAIRQRHGSVLL